MAGLASGLSPADFWASTPYEVKLSIDAYGERQKAEYRRALWQAWHVEAFQRVKQLPKLDEVMGRLSGAAPQRKTSEEILAAVRQMNAALGGKDLTQGAPDNG